MTQEERLKDLLRSGLRATRPYRHSPPVAAWRAAVESALTRKRGGQQQIDLDAVRIMAKSLGPTEIAARLGVTRQAVHRVLGVLGIKAVSKRKGKA